MRRVKVRVLSWGRPLPARWWCCAQDIWWIASLWLRPTSRSMHRRGSPGWKCRSRWGVGASVPWMLCGWSRPSVGLRNCPWCRLLMQPTPGLWQNKFLEFSDLLDNYTPPSHHISHYAHYNSLNYCALCVLWDIPIYLVGIVMYWLPVHNLLSFVIIRSHSTHISSP